MKQRRQPPRFFNKKQIKSMIVWYLILFVGILLLAWKMSDIISFFRF